MFLSRETLESIAKKPNLVRAFMLTLLMAIVATFASYNYASKMPIPFVIQQSGMRGLPPIGPEQMRQFVVIGAVAGSIGGIPLRWVITSMIVHIVSRVFKGMGTFKGLLTLAGYASIPLLIQHLLRLIDSMMVSGEALSTGELKLFADPLIDAVMNDFLGAFTVFGIWSALILLLGVCANYRVSLRRSILIAIITHSIVVVAPALLRTLVPGLVGPTRIQAPHPV